MNAVSARKFLERNSDLSADMQNQALALLAFQSIKQLPIKIRNVMLVVNLDSYGQATAGSRILWLPEESNPLSISLDEKCTILAQVIKQLDLTPLDLMRFVKG